MINATSIVIHLVPKTLVQPYFERVILVCGEKITQNNIAFSSSNLPAEPISNHLIELKISFPKVTPVASGETDEFVLNKKEPSKSSFGSHFQILFR